MQVLMIILSVALTAFAAIGGVAHGIRAVQLSRNHLDRSGLHLAALNLLEPSVTIGTLLAVGFATNAFDSSEANPLVLIAGIPLTFMLLAPLFTRAAAPLHRVVVVYGCLRWVNTVALWVVAWTGDGGYQFLRDDTRVGLTVALIASGLVLLIASVLHIGSSLEVAKTQSAQ